MLKSEEMSCSVIIMVGALRQGGYAPVFEGVPGKKLPNCCINTYSVLEFDNFIGLDPSIIAIPPAPSFSIPESEHLLNYIATVSQIHYHAHYSF